MQSIPDYCPAVEPDTFHPSPADERWASLAFTVSDRNAVVEQLERATAAVARRTEQPAPRTAAELLSRIAGFLTRLGLEPTTAGDVIGFTFGGDCCELAFENIDRRIEHQAGEWHLGNID
jgi:hypothetical protein